MQLAANITVGWADLPRSQFCATELHRRAIAAPHYERSLFHQLQLAKDNTHILGLDHLFRRTCGGYDPVLQFVSAIARLPPIPNVAVPLLCDVDLFAYAFLAGTRNFDLLMPLFQSNGIALSQILSDCQSALKSLEDFERTGTLPTKMSELDAQQYLSIRRTVARPFAQQELQILCALLVSGPSTVNELTRELGIDRAQIHQTLHLYESIKILTHWGEAPGNDAQPTFVIDKVALPLVMFCIKEILGLNLMGNLAALVDSNYD